MMKGEERIFSGDVRGGGYSQEMYWEGGIFLGDVKGRRIFSGDVRGGYSQEMYRDRYFHRHYLDISPSFIGYFNCNSLDFTP